MQLRLHSNNKHVYTLRYIHASPPVVWQLEGFNLQCPKTVACLSTSCFPLPKVKKPRGWYGCPLEVDTSYISESAVQRWRTSILRD